ncbi:MAG: hypothetical protein K8T10_20210 [Candidatus Eremiobacteraeota bacterium]|nr:hypothetical protein [Candidatus Eremiobacteraeota bacterium]
MLTIYKIDRNELKPTPDKIADVLYKGADRKTRDKYASSKQFIERYEILLSKYTVMLQSNGVSEIIQNKDFRDIFYESLPESSPIYKAADFWETGALFIATIGPALEESVAQLTTNGHLTDALFLDALGSVLVEETVERIQKVWSGNVIKESDFGRNVVPVRYSPGYCQWDVRAQEALFGYIGDKGIPVSLTSGGMMMPRKSISGIMVMERTDPGSSLVASCRICGRKCEYMRVHNG